MGSLEKILMRLREVLPPAAEADTDLLQELEMLYLEEVLGMGRALWEHDDGSLEDLSDELQNYFHALCLVQAVSRLFNSLAWDGFLSVYYNGTGQEIDHLRRLLSHFNDPLSALVDEAYEMLGPVYRFEPETNFVTKNREVDPYEVLPENMSARIDEIEAEIEGTQDASFERLLSIYQAAAPQD